MRYHLVKNVSSFALFASIFLNATLAANDNWTSFRNEGTCTAHAVLPPIRWSAESGIAWRTHLPGYGQSSPVVWDQTAFVTSSDGPWQERQFIHAIDTTTGKLQWSTEVAASTKVENYFRNSRAAPTCVVDEHRVVAFFASGDVIAVDHAGERIWSEPLFVTYGNVENERGTASSPAQNESCVFVVIDHDGPSYIVAIGKNDGQIRWKTDRGNRVPSWSSPVVVQSGDTELVVISSADSVTAYDTADGDLAWEYDGLVGNHIPSATVCGESIYTGSTKMFHQRNSDEDSIAGSNCRIDLQGRKFQVKWGAERANSYYSSPLVFAGYVYYINKAGVLFCVDHETGKQKFAKRIGNPCWASAIGVTTPDGNQYVYCVTKNGFTVVLRPGDEYDQVARNQLWNRDEMTEAAEAAKIDRKRNAVPAEEAPPKNGPESLFASMPESALHQMFSYGDPTVYAAIFANDCLLIRTGQHLYCVKGDSTTQ